MATGKSGTVKWEQGALSIQATWSETYDVSTNKSTVKITKLEAKSTSSSRIDAYYPDGKIKINGTVVCTLYSNISTAKVDINKVNTWYPIVNATSGKNITCSLSGIAHNADGSKSINITLSPNRFSYFRLYNINNTYWNFSGNKSITLTTIPRASSVSMSAGTIGSASTIRITRASSSFTHTLTYTFGSATGTIGTKVGTSISWTPSLELIKQVTNATSKIGTLTCITYNGSTRIGTKTASFTLKVPSNIVPKMNSASISIDNSANSVVAGWGLCVQGYSKVKVTASASALYNATISSYTISGGYSVTKNGTSLNYTGSALSSSGTKSFNVVAKDSRGRTSASMNAGSVEVVPYSKPAISNFYAARNIDNPKKIDITANWSYSSVNGKNTVNAILYYKPKSGSTWTEYGSISNSTNEDPTITLSKDFSETDSYYFYVQVTDALGGSVTSSIVNVPTMTVLLNFRAGGKGLGIGKAAESDSLEVALDANFFGDVYINGVELSEYIKNIINSA